MSQLDKKTVENKKEKLEETEESRKKPATEVYHNTKYKTKDANVDIPTEEAVEDAKEWVEKNQM